MARHFSTYTATREVKSVTPAGERSDGPSLHPEYILSSKTPEPPLLSKTPFKKRNFFTNFLAQIETQPQALKLFLD